MNPEYVLLGGVLWKLWKKKITLWYIHPTTPWQLRGAVVLADTVFTATEKSFRIVTPKKRVVGHGIDTAAFTPGKTLPQPDSILFLGRLDPVKKCEVFISALEKLHAERISFKADMVGSPTNPDSQYARDLRAAVSALVQQAVVTLHPAVTNDAARGLFSSHAIFVNLTPTGSFDKTMAEAMASGCAVVTGNESLRGIVPDGLLVNPQSVASVASGIRTALALSPEERGALAQKLRTYAEKEYSLRLLVARICAAF